jgi:hypothetical protein
MKLFQKALLSVVGLGLVSAAAYPYAKAYLDSLPKHLTVEEAGQVYLHAVCPRNKVATSIHKLEKEIDNAAKIEYFSSDELSHASVVQGQRFAKYEALHKAYSQGLINESRVFKNPKIVFPDVVKSDVENLANLDFTIGGLALDGRIKEANKLSVQVDPLVGRIRSNLNLPPINQGCQGIN